MIALFIIDPQRDFMLPEGALSVTGATEIRREIDNLASACDMYDIPRIITRDRHFVGDAELQRNGGPFPDHCMDLGEKNPSLTGNEGIHFINNIHLKDRVVIVPNDDSQLFVYIDENRDYVVEKQTYNMFDNPKMERLIKHLNIDKAIVCGVATDYCVKAAVLGLVERGVKVLLAADAIKYVDKSTNAEALQEMNEHTTVYMVESESVIDTMEAVRGVPHRRRYIFSSRIGKDWF